MTVPMDDALSAIGRELSVAYPPTVREPLPRELEDLVVQLVAFENAQARIGRETRGDSAIRYGAAGPGLPLHRSVSQTVALPEDVDVSRITRSVFPPSNPCIVFSPLPDRRQSFDEHRGESEPEKREVIVNQGSAR